MDVGLRRAVERWRKAGLITVAQSEAIEKYEDEVGAGHSPRAAAAQRRIQSRPGHGPPLRANRLVHPILHPPFARRPPFFVSARLVGVIAAVLAGLALFVELINAGTDLLLAPGRLPHELLGLALGMTAASLGLAGGILMWSGHRRGKRLVVGSLALDVVANAVPDPRHLLAIDSLLLVAVWILLYVLVVVSRYERLTRPVT
jgi:hypothetical protein